MIYCVVPEHLADRLHEVLREFFRDDPNITVVVERRRRPRRSASRRGQEMARADDLRVVRNPEGRRVADRRAPARGSQTPTLPVAAQPYADEIAFIKRDEPTARQCQDVDSDRLVIRAQQGDEEALATLYLRYYEPLYSYLNLLLHDAHEAEDLVQDVFTQILGVIPNYEIRPQHPFRVLLYRIARNRSIDHFRKNTRLDVEAPDAIQRRRELGEVDPAELVVRLSDSELAEFLRQLPENQLHVLLLRYMLDFTPEEIAGVLETTHDGARALQYRALQQLRKAFSAEE